MAVLIGVTSAFRGDQISDEVKRHCAVLRDTGAEPVVLSPDDDATRTLGRNELRGIVFSGGGDVSAVYYGGREELANDRVDQQRDEFEIRLMQECLTREIPTLAVCRGMELANVVLGGTLIEDLREHFGTGYIIAHHQVKESGIQPAAPTHRVSLVDDTRLHALYGAREIRVNSLHHQAIRKLAPGLRACALADDGTIEAVELEAERPFFFGVQWHPEALRDDWTDVLYGRFIAACDPTPPTSGDTSDGN
ncbi:MAG TPA: gamma-glutamyl-gamma-aminobutyrate hydrolase family protein [Candidatus Baltobacteraceae bacterium]|jgi:putative glutamine amidotransferase